jgi:hypothetical protein
MCHLLATWSADDGRLLVPRTRDRWFKVGGLTVWNNLPIALHTADILLPLFGNQLKTHVFLL